MTSEEIVDILCSLFIIIGFFIFCGIIIKQYWIDNKYAIPGTQHVGENIIMQYSNEDRKKAVQEIIHIKEDKEKEDTDGDDICRFLKDTNEQ
ncbi:hypothetical protein ACFL4Z_00875 [candidate division KSB1 bacterium]